MVSIGVYVKFRNRVSSFSVGENEILKKININSKELVLPSCITEISITDKLLIVSFEDPGFNDRKQNLMEDECAKDRIWVCDWDGNYKWSISDIVDALPVYGGFIVDKIVPVTGYNIPEYNQEHDLYSYFAGGHRYIIDLNDKRVIAKYPTK